MRAAAMQAVCLAQRQFAQQQYAKAKNINLLQLSLVRFSNVASRTKHWDSNSLLVQLLAFLIMPLCFLAA